MSGNMDWYYKANDPDFYRAYKAAGYTAYKRHNRLYLDHPDLGVMTPDLFNAINKIEGRRAKTW